MKARLSHTLLSACLFTSVVVAAEKVESHTWEVGDIPIVKVDTYRGDLFVEPSDSGRVELIVTASSSDAEAEDWLNDIRVKTTPFGAGLVISVVNTRTDLESGLDEISSRSVELRLLVPRVANLDIRASEGSIEIGDNFEGQMRARLDRGNVIIGRTKGSVIARTEVGNISIGGTTGNLTASTRSGNLVVGTVLGWAQLRSDRGGIEITHTGNGFELAAEAGGGDVQPSPVRRAVKDFVSVNEVPAIRFEG